MAVFAAAGTKTYIGGALNPVETLTTADFFSLPWLQIGKVESIGALGDVANIIEAIHLDSRRVEKWKGTRNAGDVELTMSLNPTDAGQLALVAAELTALHYAFWISFSDNGSSTGSARYFTGLVTSVREEISGANELAKLVATIAISSAILRVAAA